MSKSKSMKNAASLLGKKGGKSRSKAKVDAVRENIAKARQVRLEKIALKMNGISEA